MVVWRFIVGCVVVVFIEFFFLNFFLGREVFGILEELFFIYLWKRRLIWGRGGSWRVWGCFF